MATTYTLSIPVALGPLFAGYTLSGKLVDTAGEEVALVLSGAFVEMGGGDTGYFLATVTVPRGYRGALEIYQSGSSELLAIAAINPEDAEIVRDAAENAVAGSCVTNGLVFDAGPGSGEDEPFAPYLGYDGFPSYVRDSDTIVDLFVWRDTENDQWALAEAQGGTPLYTRQALTPLGEWAVVEEERVAIGSPETMAIYDTGSGNWDGGDTVGQNATFTLYAYRTLRGQRAYSGSPLAKTPGEFGAPEAGHSDCALYAYWDAVADAEGYLLHVEGNVGTELTPIDAWIDVGNVLEYTCVGDEGVTAAVDVTGTALPYPETIVASPRRASADIAGTTEATRIGTLNTLASGASGFAAIKQDAATIRADYMRRLTSADVPPLTAAQLAAAPTGTPNVTGVVSLGPLSDSPIEIRQHSAFRNPDGSPISILVVDDDENAIDLSDADLLMAVYRQKKPATVLWTWTSDANSALSVTGAENNEIQIDADNTHSGTAGAFRYVIWNVADSENPVTVAGGPLTVVAEAAPTAVAES